MTSLGFDREGQLVADPVAFTRAGRRRLHPHVGDLPQRHQQLDTPGLLQIDTHGELVLGARRSRRHRVAGPTGEQRCGRERVAAHPLDVDHLRTELRQLLSCRRMAGAINTPVPTARTPASGPDAGITAGVVGRSSSRIHDGICRLNSSTLRRRPAVRRAHRQPPSRHTRTHLRPSRYTLRARRLRPTPERRPVRPQRSSLRLGG